MRAQYSGLRVEGLGLGIAAPTLPPCAAVTLPSYLTTPCVYRLRHVHTLSAYDTQAIADWKQKKQAKGGLVGAAVSDRYMDQLKQMKPFELAKNGQNFQLGCMLVSPLPASPTPHVT